MIPASKFLIEAAFFHCSPGVGCGHGALALIKSWGVFASWVKRFLGLKIARKFWSKLSWLYSLLIERIVNGWSLSAFSCIYLQTAQHVSLKWQWIKLKDEKGLSSFEVALHWFSIVQAVQVQPTAEVGFGGGFSSNFQMSTIHWIDFHLSQLVSWLQISPFAGKVDPRYGVKFNVLITSMQVGARIYMDMSAVVKPTSAYGAQVGTKSCRLHAVDPAVRRLVAVAQSAIRDVVNLFWDWRLPETAWLASLPSKIFATLRIAVNLICGCFCLAVFLEIVNVKMSVPCLHQADTYAGTTI